MSKQSLDILANTILSYSELKRPIIGDTFNRFYRDVGNKYTSHRISINKGKIKTSLSKILYVVYESESPKDEILYKSESKQEIKVIGEKEIEELTNIIYSTILNNIGLINNIKVNLISSGNNSFNALMQGDTELITAALDKISNTNVAAYLYGKIDNKLFPTIEENIRILISNLVRSNSLQSPIPLDLKNIDLSSKIRSMLDSPEKIKSLYGELQREGMIIDDGSYLNEHIRNLSKISLQFNRYVLRKGLAEFKLTLNIDTGNTDNIENSIDKALGPLTNKPIIQKQIALLVNDNIKAIIDSFKAWSSKNNIMELSGSAIPNKMLEQHFYNLLAGERDKILQANTTVTKSKSSKKIKAKHKPIESQPYRTKEQPFLITRNKRGQFYSNTNLVNIINLLLTDTVRKNMGTPRLNWRTGRFARSATVLETKFSKDGYLNLYYTYMTYPYQTFEPGFAQGSNTRDPRVVIGESIKEIASTIVLNKLRVIRRVLSR